MQKQNALTVGNASSKPLAGSPQDGIAAIEAASIYGGTAIYSQRQPNSPTHPAEVSPDTREMGHPESWSISLQAVLDRPPAALPKKLMLGGLAFCLAFGTWATVGQVDEIGRAQGQLVPKGDVYKIHPLALGKVATLHVEEGETVKAGQVLVELNAELAAKEVARVEELLSADRIRLAQQTALLEQTRQEAQTRQQIAEADIEAKRAGIVQANARVEALEAQLAQFQGMQAANQDRLRRLEPLKATVEELRHYQQADVAANAERLAALEPLVSEGAVSKEYLFQAEQRLRASQSALLQSQLQEGTNADEQIFQAQQTWRDRTSAIAQTRGELQQALAQGDEYGAELAQRRAEARRTYLETQEKIQQLELERTQLQAKIAENENLLASARTTLDERFLHAPLDGVVSSLNVANPGEVVQAGQTVAEIAPKNAPLVLSASLPDREAGFVKAGMPVKVKFDAYPYQDYGIVAGEVLSISADAKRDERLGAVYKVEVALERDRVTADDRAIDLRAGQTASAEIVIRRRRIIDLLFDPIRQLRQDGLSL